MRAARGHSDDMKTHNFFGLPSEDVVLFNQGMLPLFDGDGRILMRDRDRIWLGPDGFGDSIAWRWLP